MSGQIFADQLSRIGKALLERSGLEERIFCVSETGRCWIRLADGRWKSPSRRMLQTYLIRYGLSSQRKKSWNYLSEIQLVILYLDLDVGLRLTTEVRNKLKSDHDGLYSIADIRHWCSREYIEEECWMETMQREFGGTV